MNEEFVNQMQKELGQINIILTIDQMKQFYKYYETLNEWNKKVNLTAITQMEEVITKHFVDSLAIVKAVNDIGNIPYSLIDVGTGAGFPGIPLKIAYPQLKVTMIDSLNKRVKFLKEVKELLGLKEIFPIHGRAEDLGHDNVSRETFDLSVSRAVANIATLAEYCIPFVKTGGYFISYKAGNIEEELSLGLNAIKKLGGKIEDVYNFELPNSNERSLIKIKKVKESNKIYPRKAGLPSKEPLK